MHLFLFSRGMGKENVAVHKICLQGNSDAIFGLLVGDLFWYLACLRVVWLVCGWCGWFMGSLAGLWVVWLVCGWFRVLQLTQENLQPQIPERQFSKTLIFFRAL